MLADGSSFYEQVARHYPMKIAHLINPVFVKHSSDLTIAQPITFESMRMAQQQAAGSAAVELLAVGYHEDRTIMPDSFRILPPLSRSVLDVATFDRQRKLPLLHEILDRQYDGSKADYFIYTNVDISLQPVFYLAVQDFIEQGFDAFVINRRTISNSYTAVDELPQMWAETGEAHRGWDCFVFPRTMVPQFELGNVCVGMPRVGLALLANLVAFGRCFNEFKDAHLTFHIGDDRRGKNPAFTDYHDHNTRELMESLYLLEERQGAFERRTIPGSFLWRKRTFGPLYEFWARNVYLPPRLSGLLNSFLRE